MKRFLLFNLLLLSTISFYIHAQDNTDECDLPEITETSGGGAYCMDEEVTLSITGDLGNAVGWAWYVNGDCESDPINDVSTTSITIKVTETTVYSVKGVGGCVDDEEDVDCVQIEVILDNIPPEVDCPENIEEEAEDGECYATISFDLPTGTDNCSEEVTIEQLEGLDNVDQQFPVGITAQKYSITDEYGNETICEFTVTVQDTQEPVIVCPENLEVNNDPGVCGAIVDYEIDDPIDNCPGVEMKRTEGLGSGEFFPVGETIVTYLATDVSGNTSSCSFMVTVHDVEPPEITVKDIKKSKWPPNHKHFELKIDDYIESVQDNCTDLTLEDIIIDDVSSDEAQNGTGDGNTEDDIVISDDCKTVLLLSERQGGGNGRVYTVNLAVADEHGNIGVAEIKAEVPHDKGKKGAPIDDGPVYIVNGCDIEIEEEKGENSRIVQSNVEIFETYPNPFQNSFEIVFKAESDDNVTVNLYTLTGVKIKMLYKGSVKAQKEYSWTYNSGKLNDELYLLIVNGKKSYAFKRIVQK